MLQNKLQIEQNKLRKKFLKKGIKMVDPETIFFSKIQTTISARIVAIIKGGIAIFKFLSLL